MFETEREKWIWIACAIDTECSLGLYKRKAYGMRMSKRGFSWATDLRFGTTTPILIQVFMDLSKGGSISDCKFKNKNMKPQKQYHLSSNGLRYILPKVLPFLPVKQKQAKLLIEVLNILHKGNNQWTHKNCDDTRLQEIHEELKQLNHRGIKIISK